MKNQKEDATRPSVRVNTSEEVVTFAVRLPGHVARRVRFVSVEAERTPEAYIGHGVITCLVADLDNQSSPVSINEKSDLEAVYALNDAKDASMPEEFETFTLRLSKETANRLRFCAGESGMTPEVWAADALGEAVTVVAQNILEDEVPSERRKRDAALNMPQKGGRVS